MALNPVEQRIAYLGGEWIAFRDNSAARLLVWQVHAAAERLTQAFFAAQKLPVEYRTGDLFIVFEPPFEHSIQYARELKAALIGQYEASRDELVEQGLAADWRPAVSSRPDSPAGFIAALCSLGSAYHRHLGSLVAVLLPPTVSDTGAFCGWLQRAVAAGLPDRLRLLVVDTIEQPRCATLGELDDPRMVVARPTIDALSMAQETFAQEMAVGPAGIFRNHLIGLAGLLEKGTADQVKVKALDALAFARQQKWADQEVVVRLLVGGALLKEARCAEAVKVYEAARVAAETTVAGGHPAGHKLVLQTWFGQAGAHLASGQERQAFACYEHAGRVAELDRNPLLAIEAQRMAGYCQTRLGDGEAAAAHCRRALAGGAQIRPEARGMTTLPLTASDLLKVVDGERFGLVEQLKRRLDERLAALLRVADEQATLAGPAISQEAAQVIEDDLARAIEQAERAAEADLARIVDAGSEGFRRHFAEARGLLGSDWPLAGSAGFPALAALGSSGHAG